ncbi:phage tail tape measure protein, partial [Candidatus Woesearchaeota archaeon]|nr:phage tail tape measure protein [Candidatus Woesearchaeota archaeon]
MASKIDIVIQAVDNLSGTVAKIEKNVKQMSSGVSTSMKKVEASSKQMSEKTVSSLQKMNESFGALSTNMRRIGALVGSFYAIRSAAIALGATAESFKDLNENMAYTNTIAQLTDEQLAELTTEVEDMALRVGKSAGELARGLYDVYSSGFQGAEALDVLEVASKGAIAGMTQTEVAARGLMAVMNAYNRKTGADAVDIMDSMFKTVDKGVITFEQLASEIGSVASVSSELGIPFKDISAAMSLLTLSGISASESATALESLMRSIIKPSDQAKEAIEKLNERNKDLNFQWDVATLRVRGLQGMIEDLSRATQGNYEVVGEIIPQIRGLRAEMVLGSDDVKGFNNMLEEQEKRMGATDRAYKEANKSIRRQLEDTKADWDKYQRKIGEVVALLQLQLFKTLVEVADYLSDHKEEIFDVIHAYGTFLNSITTTIGKLIELTKATDDFVKNNRLLSWLSKAIEGFAKLNRVMLDVASGFSYSISKLENTWTNTAKAIGENADAIGEASVGYREKLLEDAQKLHLIQQEAQKEGDTETLDRAKNLEEKIYNLKKLYSDKLVILNRDAGDRNFAEVNRQIIALKGLIEGEMKALADVGKLTGGLKLMGVSPEGITTPEYPGFPSREDLLGPDLDKSAEKIKKTIETITKDISEYYANLGSYASKEAEALEEQADAFEDSALTFSRYLEDINTDLTRMEEEHKQMIADINDDISKENRNFKESMDDRARKYKETMDDMRRSHTDKVEDLQHELDLEIGMGLRADEEKIKELRKRLERENREFNIKTEREQEEKEREDFRDRRSNEEKLADFTTRMEREKEAYQERTDDIRKNLERERMDYANQQADIL